MAREGGGIQAASRDAGQRSHLRATFDREHAYVAANRFPLHAAPRSIKPPTASLSSNAQLVRLLALLWLAGIATRVTILAIPPVIPLIRDDLQMTEAQVGFLVALPVLMFAVAAVPGSLLVARFGTGVTLLAGVLLTAIAGAARGSAGDIWQLAAITMLMGAGIAVIHPTLPAIVREWMPGRLGLGTAAYANGMLTAVMLAPALTIPMVLPLVGGSWRLDLALWSVPVLATAILIVLLRPRRPACDAKVRPITRWLPDWTNPLTWLLGFTFGSNNAAYYGANAFLPDFLAGQGRSDLIGPALAALNAAQFAASLVLLAAADRLLRRALPYLVFGPLTLAAFAGIVLTSGYWIVVSAAVMGFASAITFAVIIALPSVLSPPGDAHRTAAGMFTISYSCAVAIPTLSGALWDLTALPWMAFVPLGLCAITLTLLGTMLSRYPSQTE
jgi:MFS transporter, CP family, cyanate transporter